MKNKNNRRKVTGKPSVPQKQPHEQSVTKPSDANNRLSTDENLYARPNGKLRPKLMYYTVNGKCRFLLTLILLFIVHLAMAEILSGKVVKVTDGDTFTLLAAGNKQHRIRLHGIDAPETKGGQPYSRKSKDFLAAMIAGKQVKVKVKSRDRYGRVVGIVSTRNVSDVNLRMLQEGMAWHYIQYDKTPAYKKAQETAKKQRRGLWTDPSPINPHDWRKKRTK